MVPIGKFVVLIGDNGVGKTSLLNSILDLKKNDGTIEIFDTINKLPESRKKISYIPSSSIISHQKCIDFLYEISILNNMKKKDFDHKIKQL
jgi:ABC-type Mn2+/Zn2+ transport system ATPase subunit